MAAVQARSRGRSYKEVVGRAAGWCGRADGDPATAALYDDDYAGLTSGSPCVAATWAKPVRLPEPHELGGGRSSQ